MARKTKTRGQRSRQCDVVGCDDMGRVLARIGTSEISYCPKHRKKYGERIINALVNSLFNFKLTKFLTTVKSKIFMSPFLCEDCAKKTKAYILEKTKELEELETYAEENGADPNAKELK